MQVAYVGCTQLAGQAESSAHLAIIPKSAVNMSLAVDTT